MQAALEAEVTGFLGLDRYARAAAAGDARPGSRNGYREVTVKTTAGPVGLARPKLRGTTEAFTSRLFGAHVTKTNALESLVMPPSAGLEAAEKVFRRRLGRLQEHRRLPRTLRHEPPDQPRPQDDLGYLQKRTCTLWLTVGLAICKLPLTGGMND